MLKFIKNFTITTADGGGGGVELHPAPYMSTHKNDILNLLIHEISMFTN